MKRGPIASTVLTLTLAVLACSFPRRASVTEEPAETALSATLAALEPSPTPEPPPLPPHPPFIWMCHNCGGSDAWRLGPGAPTRITLPAPIGQFYDYSIATDQIAYAMTFADRGAGPGNIAVSDLSLVTVATGEVTTLFPDNIVEALWSPDGETLAYILATDTTYELHVRDLSGGDRLLASDVNFTWSFSPNGDAIAFTRESGYETPGAPGLYLVSLTTGEEIQLSDVDKSGTGSVDDRPMWTFDGEHVLLSHYGGPDAPRVVMARIDGSASWDLTLDESLSSEWWFTPSISGLLWFPDGRQMLGLPSASREMGGPPPLVLFTYDETSHVLGGGEELGMVNAIIDWDVPGETLWVLSVDGEIQRMALP